MSTFEKMTHRPGVLPPTTRAPRMALIAAISAAAALFVAACVATDTRTCLDGLRCPSDKLCVNDLNGDFRCEPVDLVMDCADKLEEEPCKYDNGNPTHICRAGVCTMMGCGNAELDPGEICDDGNNDDGDGCSANCMDPCGDGVVQSEHGEVCDDGNNIDEDGCSSDCRRLCGDGMVQEGEMCDSAIPVAGYCLPQGFDMGTLSCTQSCQEVSMSSCIDFDWQPMARVPPDWHFLRTWVFSPDNAVAIGREGPLVEDPKLDLCFGCGRIFRYDGEEWTKEQSDLPLLLGLWASGPQDIYAVGIFGNIWHFDGSEWSNTSIGSNYQLAAIWGSSAGHIFAVGMDWMPDLTGNLDTGRFTVLHYDGSNWAPMDVSQAPAEPRSWLSGVWGSDANDVFAVGTRGTILHYNGNPQGRWMPEEVASAPEELSETQLMDIWGTGAGNVVAVGESGTILRYDSEQWSPVAAPGSLDLTGIWADNEQRFYAVGANGTLLRQDPNVGEEWIELASGTSSSLHHIHGSSADNVLVVGTEGTVLRRGGDGWTAMDLPANQDSPNRVWGSGPDCIYAVTGGDDGSGDVWHYDGNKDLRWSPMPVDTRRHLRSVHGVGCGKDLFAVGWNGVILRYADGTWTRMSSPNSTTLRDIWVSGPESFFAVGENGVILRYDGSAEDAWEIMTSGVDVTLTSVWGTSAGDVFAVGSRGTVLRYNGNPKGQWERMDTGVRRRLLGIWGSGAKGVFAVGEVGSMIRYDGNAWKPMDYFGERDGTLRAVWGSSASNVFAGGENGTLLHYDGEHWSPMRSPTEYEITSIWGTPGGEQILASDENGRIFRLMLPQP